MTAPSLAPPDESRLLARPRVRESGMWAYENALRRLGFDRIAGVDEAGRGACAGPLVAGAVVLPEGRRGRVPGLADSKLLNAVVREEVYAEVVARALCWSAVVVPAAEVDRVGLHRANVAALRRALWLLDDCPSYVLSDGFPVAGLGVPGLAMWKGDRVAACIAAASVVAKVTRDRLMVEMDARFPAYGFAQHKGYITPEHQASLSANGPCPEHRRSFVNVRMRDNGRYADPDDIEDVPAVCDAAGQGDLL
ncbi:MAG TPA: ribonuclease HII [Mycobacteriales bacterium]|jgi:ribonuclease HII|nr:ribonuclease HII [Mycobacteriales bacterium]